MTREELESAQRGAGSEDRRRLRFGWEALRVCTTGDLKDLSVREVVGRRKALVAGLDALEGLGDINVEGQRIADNAKAELRRRKVIYDAWIEKHQVPRDNG
jgi:hypothetical protein